MDTPRRSEPTGNGEEHLILRFVVLSMLFGLTGLGLSVLSGLCRRYGNDFAFFVSLGTAVGMLVAGIFSYIWGIL